MDLTAELRDELAERMDRDLNGPVGGYGVWSLYYDSPQLRFYWEKIEGLKFRRKLRIRHYGEPDGVTDASPVCVEIKQRVNRVTQKRRITLPYGTARQLCDGREMVEHTPKERAFIHEVLDLVVRLNLRPTAITGYQREALVGRGSDTGLRVTFDRRIRGRDRDFHLGQANPENRFTIPPHMSVMEIKVNERTPTGSPTWPHAATSASCGSPSTSSRSRRSGWHPGPPSTSTRRTSRRPPTPSTRSRRRTSRR